jgi:putative ABC transport system permease protein
MFLRHGLSLTATGIVLGIGVAVVITRVMAAFLFGVGPMDPMTYAVVSGALAAVALLATYLPARLARRSHRRPACGHLASKMSHVTA